MQNSAIFLPSADLQESIFSTSLLSQSQASLYWLAILWPVRGQVHKYQATRCKAALHLRTYLLCTYHGSTSKYPQPNARFRSLRLYDWLVFLNCSIFPHPEKDRALGSKSARTPISSFSRQVIFLSRGISAGTSWYQGLLSLFSSFGGHKVTEALQTIGSIFALSYLWWSRPLPK